MSRRKYHQKKSCQAFSLLECLVALAIMAILSAMAIPTYLQYTKRAYYSTLVQATTPFQFGVALCLQSIGTLSGCDAGKHGIPDAIHQAHDIASLTVHSGTIHLTPQKHHGFTAADDYTLTPTLSSMGLQWEATGGAIDHGYAR